MTVEQIVALISSLAALSSLGLLFRARSQNNKDDADAVGTITATATSLVAALRVDVSETRLELTHTRTELTSIRSELGQTRNELGQTRTQLLEVLDELSEYHRRYGPLKTPDDPVAFPG